MSKKTSRSAPAGGYDFDAKRRFRRWVWSFFGGLSPTGETHTGDVLLMPSTEACEISDEALPRGFSVQQLHVVDHNPAIVATVQRRFPGINTYGCSVERACDRLTSKGIKLVGANVDYCGQISGKLLKSFKAVSESDACKGATICVNVLRGREEPYLRQLTQERSNPYTSKVKQYFLEKTNDCWDGSEGIEPTELDLWRVIALRNISDRLWFQARPYVSTNGQSFLTVVFAPKGQSIQMANEESVLMTLAKHNNGDAGDPLPLRREGERPEAYRSRLTEREHLRLHLISRQMGVGEIHFINQIVRRETRAAGLPTKINQQNVSLCKA